MNRILQKIAAGHAYIMRTMAGELHIALYYGPGVCSSAFVPVPEGMNGPARPTR